MSTEVIELEHFNAVPQADINSSTPSRQRHAVFHSFISENSKQDYDTNMILKLLLYTAND